MKFGCPSIKDYERRAITTAEDPLVDVAHLPTDGRPSEDRLDPGPAPCAHLPTLDYGKAHRFMKGVGHGSIRKLDPPTAAVLL